MIENELMKSKALPVYNPCPTLLIITLINPHALESAETSENGSSNPT